MPWIYALVGLMAGAILGIVITRITTPQYKNQKSIRKDLESAKFELEQQRQELADHFAQTAEMLDTIGKDYTKLYQHMAKTSSDLLPNLPPQDNPFSNKLSDQEKQHQEDNVLLEEAPKDYAKGATGLFKEPEKAVIHSQDVITEKAS
ncbi:Z-ring associated protein ZapG [Vibrio sp.]|uniref:Z-ring associated protein ZapG n=1 Tax=Vibrio sp. TaxID=678 RepID=UPI003D0A0F0B